VVAAAIEQHYDDRASSGRPPMAPFAVAIAPIGYGRSPAVRELADRLHDELAARASRCCSTTATSGPA
jgi:prolyl-tRNA synthetase